MLSYQELEKLFEQEFPTGTGFEEISRKLNKMNSAHKDDLREFFCNELLYSISMGYVQYDRESLMQHPMVKVFCEHVQQLPAERQYFRAVAAFFQDDKKHCLKLLAQYLEEVFSDKSETATEFCVVDWFFEPFKNAFPGFWKSIGEMLVPYRRQPGIVELCETIEAYYNCRTDEDALEVLMNFAQRFPEFGFAEELIGYTYYALHRWHNAAACFEAVEDRNIFLRNDHLDFLLGFCYGKIKNRKLEETYYRKCLEEQPEHIDALNNLGYCLYQQKRYTEARKLFEQCLEINDSYACAANNLVRTLMALGRNKDARDVVRKGYKISQSLKDRVRSLDNTNARVKETHVCSDNVDQEDLTTESSIDLGIRRQQFSSEKLLEDELTARIEAGIEVFGMRLRMYRRKGKYGRQFRIPVGRLDLLCEDNRGDLYIIELKKDSGYDDPYEQTMRYLEWFDQSEYAKGRNIYGIICLNAPSKELIKQVHGNDRIRLFEYQISYTEL